MLCIFCQYLFSSPEDCVPTLKDHIVEAKQQWVCQGNYKEYNMQILLKRFKLQASKLPRPRLGQIIQNGLASPQAEIQRKHRSFCMIFWWLFRCFFFRSNRWNIKLLPFWWFVRSWVRQKRKATWRVGESWRKDGIPHGLSRCLIRKLVQWCADVSIYVFKQD